MEPLHHIHLPAELLLLIIEWTVPSDPRVLMPPCHISTRTLLSLTRVSRVTYRLASRLLRQRCMYIDSSSRLMDFVLSMQQSPVRTLPPIVPLQHMTSLYLTPFGWLPLDEVPVAPDLATATWVRGLLYDVAATLRRLVLRMPFDRKGVMNHPPSVWETLRDGFEQLTKMEEFVCLGEYPSTMTMMQAQAQAQVWRPWPDLKRLVLFDVPLTSRDMWEAIASMPKLQHVIMAQTCGLESINIKQEYFYKLPREDPRLDRKITIVLMEAAYEIKVGDVNTECWRKMDPAGVMTVGVRELPVSFYGDETSLELVTEWAKQGALNGSIWEWGYEEVTEGSSNIEYEDY